MARATPTYTNRIRYNFVTCDVAGTPTGETLSVATYLKVDQFYANLFDKDTTNIIYDALGDAIILEIANIANIDNQQMFFNLATEQLGFFAEPIVRHTLCDHKARRFFDLNEQYFVQTTESSGIYEAYIVDEEQYWVLKEGVTVNA